MILVCFFVDLFPNQNAVSMYCRLGFAVKKGQVISSEQLHPTWKNAPSVNRLKYVSAGLNMHYDVVTSVDYRAQIINIVMRDIWARVNVVV